MNRCSLPYKSMQEHPLSLQETSLILNSIDEKNKDNQCINRFKDYIRKICRNTDSAPILGIHNKLNAIDKQHSQIKKESLITIWNLGLSDREQIRELVLGNAKTHEISNDLLDKIIFTINSRDG